MINWDSVQQQVPGIAGGIKNPFAAQINGDWVEGGISLAFLQTKFSDCISADDCISKTTDAGLQHFFRWLADTGVIPH